MCFASQSLSSSRNYSPNHIISLFSLFIFANLFIKKYKTGLERERGNDDDGACVCVGCDLIIVVVVSCTFASLSFFKFHQRSWGNISSLFSTILGGDLNVQTKESERYFLIFSSIPHRSVISVRKRIQCIYIYICAYYLHRKENKK